MSLSFKIENILT